MEKPNVFLTGGAGFIGLNLIELLLENDCSITVLDKHLDSSRIPSSFCKSNGIRWIEGDVSDADRYLLSLKDATHVVHLAANTQVIESIKNPREFVRANSDGLMAVLEASRVAGVRSFVFASSNSAVGESHSATHEENFPKPISPYGVSKLFGESICRAYYHSYGLSTVCLRFSNAYGPYSRHKTSVISRYFSRIESGKPLVVFGDGRQSRDFIHARDIGRSIVTVLSNNSKPSCKLFQVATGVETSVNQIIEYIKQCTKRDFTVVYEPQRNGEIVKNVSNISLIKKELNWIPSISLEKGLEETWGWWNGRKKE